jgi:recombination protein RecT
MANEIQKSSLQQLKEELTGTGAIKLYRDAIPLVPGLKEDQAEAIARRYGLQVYAACQQNPELAKVDRRSLFRESCKMASLDLDIDMRGLAYLVPFKGQAQALIGYKGLMELAYRSGKVKSINAEVIYESEKGKITITRIDGQISINHPWEWDTPTGEIVGAYATAIIDGCEPMTCLLRASEIESFRSKSAAPNGFGWKNNYAAMCKKTAIRRLATYLPKSIMKQFSQAIAENDKVDFDTAKSRAEKTIDEQAGSEIIDSVFEQPAEQPQGEDNPAWMNEEL